jgi:uncharacterized lipoprotein
LYADQFAEKWVWHCFSMGGTNLLIQHTMKTIQLIAATIVAAFLTGCGDPNHPVQTATELSDSSSLGTTPGATPAKADSIQASPNGPDQMVPENTTATQTVSGAH